LTHLASIVLPVRFVIIDFSARNYIKTLLHMISKEVSLLATHNTEQSKHLLKRKRENGDTARLRFRVRTRGEDCVNRLPSGIPTLLARSADERLVLVQVRRAFLQIHHPPVRMGSERDVAFSTNGTRDQKAKATVSSAREFGRLSDTPRQGRKCSQHEGLTEGDKGDRQAALIIRLDTASGEWGMGREYSGGTFWLLGYVIDSDRMRFYIAPGT
jgi:hypothetical protein